MALQYLSEDLKLFVKGAGRSICPFSPSSEKVREELGEPVSSIQRFDVSLDAAAPSLEALHDYALGWNAMEGRGNYAGVEKQPDSGPEDEENLAAVPFFQQAARWDPNFAMAYAALARCYWNLGWSVPATDNARKAYELREQVGRRERFAIDSAYHSYRYSNTKDNQYHLGVIPPRVDAARQVFEDWARTYPRDGEPHRGLGLIYFEIGQHEKSLQEFREALYLDPERAEPYEYIIPLHIFLNQLSEARAQLDEARFKDLHPSEFHWFSYQIAFLKDDVAGMAQEAAWASTVGDADLASFMYTEADTSAYHGKLGNSLELLHRALEIQKRAGRASAAWRVVAHEAFLECLFGDLQECRRRAGAIFDDYALESSDHEIVFTLALGGEIGRPEKFVDKWEKKDPEDPGLGLPLIRAQLWLNRKNPAKAIEILKNVTPAELVSENGVNCVFVRGYANLAAPHLDNAEADFQEILDHRGMLVNSPVAAVAHVGLARSRVERGDTAAAKSAYENFFKLWKDADPDIPILKQAKAEYAKLQ